MESRQELERKLKYYMKVRNALSDLPYRHYTKLQEVDEGVVKAAHDACSLAHQEVVAYKQKLRKVLADTEKGIEALDTEIERIIKELEVQVLKETEK